MYKIMWSPQDLLEYRKSIPDVYRQFGKPKRYPCAVKSNFWDNANGPYSCDHIFIYPEFKWSREVEEYVR